MEDISPSIILSIAPGSRSLGVSVFEGTELLYYGVKEAGKHRSQHTPHSRSREAAATVDAIIHKYRPDVFAIAQLNSIQRLSPKLTILSEYLRRLARHRRLVIHEYQPSAVRRSLDQAGRGTKQATVDTLTALYPELTRFSAGVSMWQRLYYARLFTAVSVGHVCAQELLRAREKTMLAALDEFAPPPRHH